MAGRRERGDEREAEAARRVMDALRRLVRVLAASARAQGGAGAVTGAQRFVLRQVAAAPGLSIGELATRTLVGQSTVSGVVARLVERGLVVRGTSPADGRQTTLELTARGRRAVADAEPTAQERLADAVLALPDAQRVALADALDAWLATAGLAEVPPTMFFEDDGGARPRRGVRP